MAGPGDEGAAANKAGKSSTIEPDELPPLAALFLIRFDLKVGYTIAWKRSNDGLQLEGVVEFKSLPSGLHNVKEDLVYFVHEQYAGLSAFVNRPAAESERNAHLIAVGILVPLSYGRLGRSWLHAQNLQELAAQLVDDVTKVKPLEEYWEEHRSRDENGTETSNALPSSPTELRSNSSAQAHSQDKGRSRGMSIVTTSPGSTQSLPTTHPALSILRFIDAFGPLIYPLHRAALLRKRILFVISPPVRLACEYVYILSILSSIPSSSAHLLPENQSYHRLRPFFSIGVHDIPLLQDELKAIESPYHVEDETPFGWVSCTTDEVLATKPNLYDILVEIPPITDHAPSQKQWPKIRDSRGNTIKATQRDARRYKLLADELSRFPRTSIDREPRDTDTEIDDGDRATLLPKPSNPSTALETDTLIDDSLVEPVSWSAVAYSGFMWWASAGEQDVLAAEEAECDRELVCDVFDFELRAGSGSEGAPPQPPGVYAAPHTAVVASFHRITSLLVSEMAEAVEAAGEEEEGDRVVVTREDLVKMGLDMWSEADKGFVKEMIALYFDRDAETRENNRQLASVEPAVAAAAENTPVATQREVTEVTSGQEPNAQPSITEEPEAPASETEDWITDAEGDEDADGFNGPVGIDPSLLGDASDYGDNDSDDTASGIGRFYLDVECAPQVDFWVPGSSRYIDDGEHEFREMRTTDIDDDDEEDVEADSVELMRSTDISDDQVIDFEIDIITNYSHPVPAALLLGSDAGCTICTSPFSPVSLPVQIACGHAFCRHCILA
ncbi:hypothetical protein H2201_005329 [Coniosporium apollinis]|uniref:RING-type domain-containing protein n=1 Tax=Coniosporium apollinis TaxID=61459 RepID=A0ABQ9NTA2_9PEZI|nr:hypothetical protein H2201_005329 [Coniosporium apollinis]